MPVHTLPGQSYISPPWLCDNGCPIIWPIRCHWSWIIPMMIPIETMPIPGHPPLWGIWNMHIFWWWISRWIRRWIGRWIWGWIGRWIVRWIRKPILWRVYRIWAAGITWSYRNATGRHWRSQPIGDWPIGDGIPGQSQYSWAIPQYSPRSAPGNPSPATVVELPNPLSLASDQRCKLSSPLESLGSPKSYIFPSSWRRTSDSKFLWRALLSMTGRCGWSCSSDGTINSSSIRSAKSVCGSLWTPSSGTSSFHAKLLLTAFITLQNIFANYTSDNLPSQVCV